MAPIIWQPVLNSRYDFIIHLDRNYAENIINSHISIDKQNKMNQLANEELKRLSINWSNPYQFYNDSCLITQIYIGNNGVWLSTNHQTIDDLLKKEETQKLIEYHSHNVDTSNQAYTLMALFDLWIRYVDILKEN